MLRQRLVSLLGVCSITGLLVLSCGENAVAQGVTIETIQRLKRSLVPVVCVGVNPDSKQAYLISVEGTGFVVADDGSFVTAGHVAKGLFVTGRVPVCAIQAIYVPRDGWDSSNPDFPLRLIGIQQCWWNDDTDVGICTLKENPFTVDGITKKPVVAEFESKPQAEGTAVAFSGFPLQFLQPITSQGTIGAYRSVVGDNLGPRDLIVDKNAWPGASGSPVYTDKGMIVGILIQRGFNDASGLAFVRTTPYVQKFLADNKTEREKDTK